MIILVQGMPFGTFANEASKARKYNEENGYNVNFSLTYDVPFIKGLSLKGMYAVNYSNALNTDVGHYYQLARATNTKSTGYASYRGSYSMGISWNMVEVRITNLMLFTIRIPIKVNNGTLWLPIIEHLINTI